MGLPESSFPDAEPAENAVEDIVGHDGADDATQLIHGEPEVESDELISAFLNDDSGGRRSAAEARSRLPRHRAPVPERGIRPRLRGPGASVRSRIEGRQRRRRSRRS